jgi:tetratricopeptide (TPR) repeat protein
MLNIGLAYINMQNYQEAEAAFTNLITKKPEYAEAYYYRGLSRKYLVAYEGALADYSQAITLGMHTAEIYYSRGGLYYEIRSLDAALSDLDQAIAMRLNYASAYYLRGLVNQLRGDEAAACSDYTNGCANGSQAACMEKNNLCQ